ncbi:MAG: hypothetical protein AAGE84_02075 [Cyanobacteria bacterium P01_G01_bin.39]
MNSLANNKNIDDKYHKILAILSQEKAKSSFLVFEINTQRVKWLSITIFLLLPMLFSVVVFNNNIKNLDKSPDVSSPRALLFDNIGIEENYIFYIAFFVLIVSFIYSSYKFVYFSYLIIELDKKINRAKEIHETLIDQYNKFKYM